jgi:hypothetical protein
VTTDEPDKNSNNYTDKKVPVEKTPLEEELESAMMNAELYQMSRDEEAHLEKEFENYDKLYPRQ